MCHYSSRSLRLPHFFVDPCHSGKVATEENAMQTDKRDPDFPASQVSIDLLDNGRVMVNKIRNGEATLTVEVWVHESYITVKTANRMTRRDENLSHDECIITER